MASPTIQKGAAAKSSGEKAQEALPSELDIALHDATLQEIQARYMSANARVWEALTAGGELQMEIDRLQAELTELERKIDARGQG